MAGMDNIGKKSCLVEKGAIRELLLPEKLVAAVNRLYPKVWRQIDAARAHGEKGKWPLEVFLPMHMLVDMGKDIFGTTSLSLRQIADFNKIGAASAWRPAQDVVRFDPQVYDAVISTPLSGNFPIHVLWRLPAWAIYIESPGLRLMDSFWDGFIARLDISGEGQKRLRLFFLAPEKEVEFVLPLGSWTMEHALNETILKTRAALSGHGVHVPEVEDFDALDGMAKALNLVLYVCSYGLNDVMWRPEAYVSYPLAKRVKGGWRLFPPDKPRLHLLGGEVGERMRSALTTNNSGGTHASPRPHLRRAHWHGYWFGPRRKDSGRHFATRWLPPIPVAMGMDEEISA